MNKEDTEKVYRGSRALAERLGVSHPYALKLLRERQITHQIIGGACRVREEDVRKFEERATVRAHAA
jgi:excisionase family DNA binding protein